MPTPVPAPCVMSAPQVAQAHPGLRTLVANFKMTGSGALFDALVGDLAPLPPHLRIVLCPPFPYLRQVGRRIEGRTDLVLGAQNLSHQTRGAYTGEVSGEMLADCGVQVVLIGHSECRTSGLESPDSITQKMQRASEVGIRPLVCLGESAEVRRAGQAQDAVVQECQTLFQAPVAGDVAYEPLWAIGSDQTPSLTEIATLTGALAGALARPLGAPGSGGQVFYGGSVTASNVGSILQIPGLGGVLVGKACWEAASFRNLVLAACALHHEGLGA